MKLNKQLPVSIVFAFCLTACGGGGGGSSDDDAGGDSANSAPQFTYAGVNQDTAGNGYWTDTPSEGRAELNYAQSHSVHEPGYVVLELDLVPEERPYILSILLSADDALDEGDAKVIGVGCNSGVNSACVDFIFWECHITESPREFSGCEDSETGSSLPDANSHAYDGFVDEHGAGAAVWMIFEACAQESDGSGGFENACSEVALPVTVY